MVCMDVASDDRRDAQRLGEIAQARVATCVTALVRPLELDEEAVRAESPREASGAVRVAHREAVPRAARETDEPVAQLFEQTLVEGGVRGRLRFFPWETRIGVCRRDQPAEVRVALWCLDEQRDVRAVGQ